MLPRCLMGCWFSKPPVADKSQLCLQLAGFPQHSCVHAKPAHLSSSCIAGPCCSRLSNSPCSRSSTLSSTLFMSTMRFAPESGAWLGVRTTHSAPVSVCADNCDVIDWLIVAPCLGGALLQCYTGCGWHQDWRAQRRDRELRSSDAAYVALHGHHVPCYIAHRSSCGVVCAQGAQMFEHGCGLNTTLLRHMHAIPGQLYAKNHVQGGLRLAAAQSVN